MEKPQYLYHASDNKNIEVFEPRAESIRDAHEGAVVFGTPDKTFCSMFIVKSDDSWTSKGKYNGVWYHAISDEKRFRELDKGGAIYTLPNDTFYTDLTKGMKDMEWISKVPVVPIDKEIFDSGLDSMLENNVNVLFITKEIFEEFKGLMKKREIDKAFELLFSQKQYTK